MKKLVYLFAIGLIACGSSGGVSMNLKTEGLQGKVKSCIDKMYSGDYAEGDEAPVYYEYNMFTEMKKEFDKSLVNVKL